MSTPDNAPQRPASGTAGRTGRYTADADLAAGVPGMGGHAPGEALGRQSMAEEAARRYDPENLYKVDVRKARRGRMPFVAGLTLLGCLAMVLGSFLRAQQGGGFFGVGAGSITVFQTLVVAGIALAAAFNNNTKVGRSVAILVAGIFSLFFVNFHRMFVRVPFDGPGQMSLWDWLAAGGAAAIIAAGVLGLALAFLNKEDV